MGILAKVYAELSGTSALTAIVSSAIYPDHRFQPDTTPAVVFWRAPGGERMNDLKGYGGKENPVLEVLIYTTAIDTRREAADACITAITESTRFTALLPIPPWDDYDDETQTYERVLQFSVWD